MSHALSIYLYVHTGTYLDLLVYLIQFNDSESGKRKNSHQRYKLHIFVFKKTCIYYMYEYIYAVRWLVSIAFLLNEVGKFS